MKNFYNMVKLETKRITRNKFILSMLLLFSIVLLIVVSFSQLDRTNYPIAIYTNGGDGEQIQLLNDIFSNFEDAKIVEVGSIQEGKKLMRQAKACLFISFDVTTTPVTADIYYDSSSVAGSTIKESLEQTKNTYAYESIMKFLKDYGITMNDNYFNQIEFKSLSETKIPFAQKTFILEVGCCLSIILMFGLAYSISRDNETNVSRNIKFMPLNIHKYLWSKIIPYLVLGVLESVLIFAIGGIFFKINYEINVFFIITMCILFNLSVIMMGLLFSMCKSQISTVFLGMATILLPMFVISMTFVENLPILMRFLFYVFPISLFVKLGNGMMFNGVVLGDMVVCLIIQVVVYYLLTIFVLKRKINR